VFASSLRRDLENAAVGKAEGRLVSFLPTLSEGMSPALDEITRRVNERFGEEPDRATEQLLPWH
jgi:hypothetical protein